MNAKNLTNEELAAVLRVMTVTGICPSRDEKEYLLEAADRLEEVTDYRAMVKRLKPLQEKADRYFKGEQECEEISDRNMKMWEELFKADKEQKE